MQMSVWVINHIMLNVTSSWWEEMGGGRTNNGRPCHYRKIARWLDWAGLSVSVNQYCFNYLVDINAFFSPSGFSNQAGFYLFFLGTDERDGEMYLLWENRCFWSKRQFKDDVWWTEIKKKKSPYAVMNIQPCAKSQSTANFKLLTCLKWWLQDKLWVLWYNSFWPFSKCLWAKTFVD